MDKKKVYNPAVFMITESNFKTAIGHRFWVHIHKNTLLPYPGRIPSRTPFLKALYKKVDEMRYVPMPPRGYVVSHKKNLVVRFIPSLRIEDYCVYFFCIKYLENEIAENRVKGTFGGWRLGGRIRELESLDDPPSTPDGTYNRFAWKQAWTEYQRRALQLFKKNEYQYFIICDIANFYDCIRLNRLETLVREAVSKEKTQVVNLLFYFLANWGKRDLNYGALAIGLPQDEVGDCSRILANFYLQNYDKCLFDATKANDAKYLRYADDQIIAAKDERTAKKLMFDASKELAKLGLNLNASKAQCLTRQQFHDYWSFDIFTLLQDRENEVNIQAAFDIYKARLAAGTPFRPDVVLKRLLNCNLNKLSAATKSEILADARKQNFLTNIDGFYFKQIYNFLPRAGKNAFLKQLDDLSDEVLFNQFHLRVMKFVRDNRINRSKLPKLKGNFIALKDLNF